jgi:hypothetical protein
MCQSAINLITKNLHTVENDELLLRIKGRVALFMLTMEVRSLEYHMRFPANKERRNGGTQSRQ